VVAADDELADLATGGGTARASSIHASVPGIAIPTDPGPALELVRRQVADALALGLAVHREEGGARERPAHASSRATGERRAGVGQRAQVRQLAVGEALQGHEHLPDRRARRAAP
jgi:hypothetical protein